MGRPILAAAAFGGADFSGDYILGKTGVRHCKYGVAGLIVSIFYEGLGGILCRCVSLAACLALNLPAVLLPQ